MAKGVDADGVGVACYREEVQGAVVHNLGAAFVDGCDDDIVD